MWMDNIVIEYALPPPPLDIHGAQAVNNWVNMENYSLAMQLNNKSERIQVVTLLTVIGEKALKVFTKFTGSNNNNDRSKIKPCSTTEVHRLLSTKKSTSFERY